MTVHWSELMLSPEIGTTSKSPLCPAKWKFHIADAGLQKSCWDACNLIENGGATS